MMMMVMMTRYATLCYGAIDDCQMGEYMDE